MQSRSRRFTIVYENITMEISARNFWWKLWIGWRGGVAGGLPANQILTVDEEARRDLS